MKKVVWTSIVLGMLVMGSLLGPVIVNAQAGGPASGAIQLALRSFLATANTWTGVQTFGGGTRFTGVVKLPDGSAAAPSLTFASSPTYGLFFGGAVMQWTAAGAARGTLGAYVTLANSGGVGWSSTADPTGTQDIFLRRSAAKTLTIDTDGAGGALTLVDVKGPLTSSALLTGLNVSVANTGGYYSTSNGKLLNLSDGVWQFTNNGATSWTRLILGTNDATTNGASWNLNAGVLEAKTGDATAYANLKASQHISTSAFVSGGSGMAVANVGANSCGTTAATIAGNNNAFVITVGATSGSQCRVAFTVTAATEWDCAANDDTTTVAVRTTPVDTTHTDLIGAFTAADKVTGICFPR